jgi:two-component system KDP operon response regulator KdpE
VSTTVLVIEDEPDIRLTARFMLESAGHNVIEAATGAESLPLLASARPDLVLLDIRLPDMEGWEVMSNVRSSAGMSDVPVVIMSAHSSGDFRERAMLEGSDGYLVKPFREDDLLRTVDGLVRNRKPSDPRDR